MPSWWEVPLGGPVQAAIPVEAVHAVVTRWLDTDHTASVKHYSIAPPSVDGQRLGLGIGLVDDDLAGRLSEAAGPGTPVRLGRHQFTVTAAPRELTRQSWDDLRAPTGQRAWELEFLSPTSFRRGNRTSPFPAPVSVLSSLAARLPASPGVPAPDPHALAGTVWVSDIDGSTTVLALKRHLVSGFLGRVRYECDGDAEQAAGVERLLRLAPYAGVGSHTVYGLGRIRLLPTRPAAPERRR